jgi:hypothetical protein
VNPTFIRVTVAALLRAYLEHPEHVTLGRFGASGTKKASGSDLAHFFETRSEYAIMRKSFETR